MIGSDAFADEFAPSVCVGIVAIGRLTEINGARLVVIALGVIGASDASASAVANVRSAGEGIRTRAGCAPGFIAGDAGSINAEFLLAWIGCCSTVRGVEAARGRARARSARRADIISAGDVVVTSVVLVRCLAGSGGSAFIFCATNAILAGCIIGDVNTAGIDVSTNSRRIAFFHQAPRASRARTIIRENATATRTVHRLASETGSVTFRVEPTGARIRGRTGRTLVCVRRRSAEWIGRAHV